MKDLLTRLTNAELEMKINIADNIYNVSAFNDVLGDVYSFSSTDFVECLMKINEFSKCLTDSDKFFNFINKIKTEELEVA